MSSSKYSTGEMTMMGDVVEAIKAIGSYHNHQRFTVERIDKDGDVAPAEGYFEFAHWFRLVKRADLHPVLTVDNAQLPLANLTPGRVVKVHVEPESPPRMTPDVRCACCHIKASRIVVKDHPCIGNILGMSRQVNQPDLRGWLIMAFPYKDPYIQERDPSVVWARFGVAWPEVQKVCPKCALQVQSTVKHMVEGWRK